MIKDYDEGKLSLKQEERFIKHIMGCDDCKEELEIYYIVTYGIDSYDFKTLVDLKLRNSVEQCRQVRQWNHNMRIMYAVIDAIMLLMILVCIIIRFY